MRLILCCSNIALIVTLSAGCDSQIGRSGSSLPDHAAMPPASSQDLLYVVSGGYGSAPGKLSLYTYPQGQRRKTVTGSPLSYPGPECADDSGNVYIVNNTYGSVYGYILVYAHGKTEPTRMISSYYTSFTDCAVDPTSGNLAVTFTGRDGVLVYLNAKGKPKYYVYPPYFYASGCTYDDSGNLFVAGAWIGKTKRYPLRLVELPLGQSTFISIKLPHIHWPSTTPGDLHWDGANLALANGEDSIYRLAVSGTNATIVGVTKLNNAHYIRTFWIQDGTLVAASAQRRVVKIWNYPSGGKATAIVSGVAGGVAVSVPGQHH
jgi:WD40 repeat protein